MCKIPTLDLHNQTAWMAFNIAQSQLRVVGMGHCLGIEFPAIDRAIDHVGVPEADRWEVFEKVRQLGEWWARYQNQRAIDERPVDQRPKPTPISPPPFYASLDEADEAERDDEDLDDNYFEV